jgi:sporulation protein YlmC with PRC-barrel domain
MSTMLNKASFVALLCAGGVRLQPEEGTLMTKKFALAAVAAALLSTTALAQSNPPAGSTSAPAARAMDPVAVQSHAQGKWRASKLIGVNVYNANNEKIGDINELVTDSSGKIDTIVIGAGGFLGMGEHNVGIPFSQVKFVNEPARTSSTTTTSDGTRTTGSGTATTTTSSAARDYPDHAMINMTKDQLKALPAFKYASDTSATRTTAPTPAR